MPRRRRGPRGRRRRGARWTAPPSRRARRAGSRPTDDHRPAHTMEPAFRDRAAAGLALARSLGAYAGRRDVVVLGMARGGVPVARAVSDALGAPLDVAVARKLGVPGIEEVALGAIA